MARGVTAPVLVLLFLALSGAPASAADYDFSVSPDPPNAGQPATLSVVPAPPADATVAWDLDGVGDFETSGATVTHTFAAPGPADVRVRVTEADNKKTTVSRTVAVNAAPAVDFSFAPLAPVIGQDVLFTPVVSDPEGDGFTVTWSFGDGAFDTASSPAHAYGSTGTYSVLLTAVDDHGAAGTAQRDVAVADAPPADQPPADPPADPPPADPPAEPTGGAVAPEGPSGGGTGPTTTTKTTRPVRMRPFPVVRIAGVVLDRGAVIRILSVRAPRGADVRVRCRGRGCPVGSVARGTATSRVVRFHRFERRLQAGTVLELFVRKANRIGKYTRILIRAGKPPTRVDRCLMPGRKRPVSCR